MNSQKKNTFNQLTNCNTIFHGRTAPEAALNGKTRADCVFGSVGKREGGGDRKETECIFRIKRLIIAIVMSFLYNLNMQLAGTFEEKGFGSDQQSDGLEVQR